jgi:hypothetical protein
VETFADSEYRRRVPDAAASLKSLGNVFQRLDDLADLFGPLGTDPRDVAGIDWAALKRLWAARHAHTHADGRVDEKYLRAVPNSPLQLGQRVVVSQQDARGAIELAATLCAAIGGRVDDRPPS